MCHWNCETELSAGSAMKESERKDFRYYIYGNVASCFIRILGPWSVLPPS